MKKLPLVLVLLLAAGVVSAQSVAPACNNFDPAGVPILAASPYPAVPVSPYNYNCTDYFGVGNWANSPMPSSPITGFTLVAGGSGYATPVVIINDPSGSGATGTATATAGVVTAVTVGTQGAGYIVPQVTIVDMGPGWISGPATCGALPLPACGSGAMATAVLGGPYTGGMLKFQDALVDLKTLIATPDQVTFPGSDYYEIVLVKYTQKMHANLPPTTLLGYEQVASGSVGCGNPPILGPNYLGPTIVAQKNRPVRIKFTNCLAPGSGGNLFVPTDNTYMGAGLGPDHVTPYTENRATLHLHGGATPWISDGTPHQWTVPYGDTATYQKGDSAANVPDMFFDSTGKVTALPECSATVTTNCYPTAVPVGLSNSPGHGSLAFFWTNQQGGRLMFFHDHAYGLTRLNVYAGEAAGYLLVDPAEENTLAGATAPGTVGATPDLAHLIPLVIQDKSFVPSAAQIGVQDPTWAANYGTTPGAANLGDLWFPHTYMTNQNPSDPGGANGFGRWDYGAWFFPPMTTLTAANPPDAVTIPCTSAAFPGQILEPTAACPQCGCPITPNPSGTPEGFMDTPVVNGVAYPILHVAPAAYRFRILSVGNDRSLNLSWFIADGLGFKSAVSGGSTEVAMLPAVPPAAGTLLPLCTAINPVAIPSLDLGMATALFDVSGNPINGTGLPANCWPNYGPQAGIPAPQTMWAADGRAGGAPDPRHAGPPWIQIGTEGGLLPSPVVIPATPVNYEQNTRSITITNVAVHGLWLGPAERADAIVDFSNVPAQCAALGVSPCTLILYNDAPTPAPAFDSRNDYFSGDGDQSPIGGAPNTPPGYGPNTRTIMQVVVDQTAPNVVPFSLPTLKTAFASTTTPPTGLFPTTQPTVIVPEAAYNSAYNANYTNSYASIQANTLTYFNGGGLPGLILFKGGSGYISPVVTIAGGGATTNATATATQTAGVITDVMLTNPGAGYTSAPTITVSDACTPTPCGGSGAIVGSGKTLEQKTIQELFTLDYGRMNATLGTELPLTNFQTQTTVPLGYVDWPTELIKQGDTQLWKITHNGVDTHFIHFHLFNVQVINRMGWDGTIRPPDPNETTWKETVRMNPLEDILVALQPITPTLPFPIPDSIRNNDVTWPAGQADPAISGLDPNSGNATITTINNPVNFGWEYVWHCHILGHEENDMMRPIIFMVPPPNPASLSAGATASTVALTWTDNSSNEDSFNLERSTTQAFLTTDPGYASFVVNLGNSTGFSTVGWGQPVSFTDSTVVAGTQYYYRVQANDSFTPINPNPVPFQQTPLSSGWSNVAVTGLYLQNVTFTGAPASAAYNTTFAVTATTDAGVMPTLGLTGVCSSTGFTGTPASATATITMTSGTGSCALTANWAAIGNFAAATLSQTTAASLAAPTVTFTGAPASASYSTSFSVTAGTNAGVMPTIAGTAGVCTVGAVGGTSTAATASILMISGTGTCTLTAAWPATTNYSANSTTQATVAAKLGSITTITSNAPNPSVVGQPVVVSFTVASNPLLSGAVSGPSGNVTVTGNGSSCTGALTPGTGPGAGTSTGSCSLAFSSSGAKTITATYNADANFTGSASAGAAQTVWDFSNVAKTLSQTVNGNQKATYTFTLTPLGGFTGTVVLTCGGTYPPAYACSVNPVNDPLSGGKSSNVTLTVNTAKGFPGTYTVTLTGVYGSGNPATGGLTHAASASLTVNN